MKFKVGDVCICVDPTQSMMHPCVLGGEYTVVSLHPHPHNPTFDLVHMAGHASTSYARRYKLKEEEKPLFSINDTYEVLRKEASRLKIVGYSRMDKIMLVEVILIRLAFKPAADVKQPIVKVKEPTVGEQLIKKADRNSTCSYAVEYKNGHVDYHPYDVCHARIALYGKESPPKAVYLNLKQHYENHAFKPEYKAWVEWMTTASPYAAIYGVDGGFAAIIKGCIRIDADKWGVNQIATAAVALREGSEFPERLVVWKKLVDAGYSKLCSWIFAQNSYTDKLENKLQYRPQTGAHQSYAASYFPENKVLEFFKHHKWVVPGPAYGSVKETGFRCNEAITGMVLYGALDDGLDKLLKRLFNIQPAAFGGKTYITDRQMYAGMEKLEEYFK